MTIKGDLEQLVRHALDEAQRSGRLPTVQIDEVAVERPQNPAHGDFACSLPLKLARPMRMAPMAISEQLISAIPSGPLLGRAWAAPPGFVNFSLDRSWLVAQVDAIRERGAAYGDIDVGAGQRVQVEFVSINPTGPLHVGHARGAVIGSALANVLSAAGYDVVREYYFNDSGNQMDRFYQSLYARYAQQLGRDVELPPDGYAGQYLVDLADSLIDSQGDGFLQVDRERATEELGKLGIASMMEAIREDVRLLRIDFDVWFSEASLYENGQFERSMSLLRELDFVVERDGAVWFASTKLGEEQDKVLVRRTGAPTYFATDVAYHYNKFIEREFDRVVNVLGADHQGHVAQMHSLVRALEVPSERLSTIVHQMVTLKRRDEVVRASKRTGAIVTLRELVDEVGADACRYVFLSRSPESQMEFDLELAKEEVAREPRLLRPVRPRPHSGHLPPRRGGGDRLRRRRPLAAGPRGGAGSDTQDAGASRASGDHGREPHPPPPPPLRAGAGDRLPALLRALPGHLQGARGDGDDQGAPQARRRGQGGPRPLPRPDDHGRPRPHVAGPTNL